MLSLSDLFDGGPCAVSGRHERFDLWAPFYGDSALQRVLYRPVHAAVLHQVSRYVPSPASVLDVGCGSGELLSRMGESFPVAQRVGLDLSAPMLRQMVCAMAVHNGQAASPGRVASAVQAEAERLPFRDGVFDVVISTLSLRHWADAAAGLAEVSRVAALDGVVIIAEALALPARRVLRGRGRPGGLSLLRQAFERAGLALCAVEPVRLSLPLARVMMLVSRKSRPVLIG